MKIIEKQKFNKNVLPYSLASLIFIANQPKPGPAARALAMQAAGRLHRVAVFLHRISIFMEYQPRNTASGLSGTQNYRSYSHILQDALQQILYFGTLGCLRFEPILVLVKK